MFVFNLKISRSKIFKIIIITLIFIAISIFILAIYNITKEIFTPKEKNIIEDSIENDIAYLSSKNYTNVLKQVHENLEDYIGQKICFTGYVYRVPDINENQFVLARDMIINSNNQTLVVGFLCEYNNSKNLENNSWVNITGTIDKTFFFGEIPYIKIERLETVNQPEDYLVYPPDDTYVPTAVIY